MLPPLRSRYDSELSSRLSPNLLFDQSIITECLKTAGLDTGKIQHGSGYNTNALHHRHSWVDTTGRNSIADINAGGTELDSGGSSPGVQRVCPHYYFHSSYLYKSFIQIIIYNCNIYRNLWRRN